jgi:hypothetical protein
MSLFSVHNSATGALILYVEETEANLDIVEEIVAQVPLLCLARLREHQLKDGPMAEELDCIRGQIPNFVTKVASMSEAEALDLAEQLIDSVKFARAIAGRPVKLELVK